MCCSILVEDAGVNSLDEQSIKVVTTSTSGVSFDSETKDSELTDTGYMASASGDGKRIQIHTFILLNLR